jgi:DNA primase
MLDDSLRQTIQDRAAEIIGTIVDLKRHGKNLLGRCPFHNDVHPSFSVSPEKGLFHCFGCGAGGDVFAFLMRLQGLSFPEAVTEAARMLGIPPPPRTRDSSTADLATAAERATQVFERWLWQPEGAPGRRYLRQRGILAETAKKFRLGFHPDQPTLLVRALASRGVRPETAQALGLLTRKNNRWVSCMRGRLVFPIQDGHGQVRGFGVRTITRRGPKYLNSPDSPLFHKGQLLYGLTQARPALRERGEALLVEGYVDVLMLHQAGCTHVVSPLSTTVSVSQLSALRPLVKRVVLLFDGDAAGQEAITRILLPAEESGVRVEVAVLPTGEDPDSYVRVHGRAALDTLLASTKRLDLYVLDQLVRQHPREQAGREMLALAGQLTHPITQLTFLQLAEATLCLPAGSLTETAGIGHAARQRLEELFCGLLLTVPEVRERLRGVSLPLRNPHLRALAARALRNEPITGEGAAEAKRLATAVRGVTPGIAGASSHRGAPPASERSHACGRRVDAVRVNA